MNKLLVVLAIVVLVAGGSASAQTLFAASGSNGVGGTLYTINASNGAVLSSIGSIVVGATPVGITGLAFHPTNGTLYGVTTNSGLDTRTLVTINASTGAATIVGAAGALGTPVSDISFDSSGVLYGWGGGGDSSPSRLGTINLTTGVFTSVGSIITNSGGGGLAFSPVSPFTLYLSIDRANGPLRTVNKGTGVTTAGPTMSGAPIPAGVINALAVNNAGTLYGVDTNQSGESTAVDLVTINTTSGAVTNLGALPGNTDALAFQVSGVTPPPPPPPTTTPIPTSALLMMIGLACLALYQFRGKLLGGRS